MQVEFSFTPCFSPIVYKISSLECLTNTIPIVSYSLLKKSNLLCQVVFLPYNLWFFQPSCFRFSVNFYSDLRLARSNSYLFERLFSNKNLRPAFKMKAWINVNYFPILLVIIDILSKDIKTMFLFWTRNLCWLNERILVRSI